eukprot:tig00020746_g13654.t1
MACDADRSVRLKKDPRPPGKDDVENSVVRIPQLQGVIGELEQVFNAVSITDDEDDYEDAPAAAERASSSSTPPGPPQPPASSDPQPRPAATARFTGRDPASRFLYDLQRGAVPQQAAPPYRVDPGEAERLEVWVEASAESLRRSAPHEVPDTAARLARALADARLCSTPLYRTFAGRWRLRTCLGALRVCAGQTGCRLVWAAVRCVAEALVQPLPPPAGDVPGAPEWEEDDVETIAEHAIAFVEAFTTWADRVDPHHFEADLAACERLADHVEALSLPFAASRRPTRALALFLRAFVLRVFERRGPAVEAMFEVWSELRRKQLTPSALEARLVGMLANSLFETQQIRVATAVAEAGYELGGTEEEAVLSKYRFHTTCTEGTGRSSRSRFHRTCMHARRFNGDLGAARRHARALVETAERLGPDYWQLKARAAFELSIISFFRRARPSQLSKGSRMEPGEGGNEVPS